MNHNECTLTIMYGRKTSFHGSKSEISFAAFGRAAQPCPLAPSMITTPDVVLSDVVNAGNAAYPQRKVGR